MNSVIENSGTPQEDSSSSAKLLLDNKNFSNIIIDFLGKKETLTSKSKRNFVLQLNDIEQFNHLVNDKISKEHTSHISHLMVVVDYNDGTSRTISSSEELSGYTETRDVVPTSVIMIWKVVINFPQVNHVETQEITLYFQADEKKRTGYYYSVLNIEHTNIVWANEIQNILSDKIKSIQLERSTTGKIIDWTKTVTQNSAFWIASLFSSLIFLVLSLSYAVEQGPASQNTKEYRDLLISAYETESDRDALFTLAFFEDLSRDSMKPALERIQDKEIALRINNWNERRQRIRNKKMLLLISSIVCLFVFAFYIKYYIKHNTERSFIVMTEKSRRIYEAYRDRSEVPFYSVSTIVFTLIMGLIVNIISASL